MSDAKFYYLLGFISGLIFTSLAEWYWSRKSRRAAQPVGTAKPESEKEGEL